ncbi:hypothetical protein [Butyrivibrio sp. WCE2006]|uniref:hypothetical protein n=1 Tax=Butyrivibrio sp. WCE2006 TaxID=1410611 RepID=UPI0005D2459D|nr:hypothetical protein [Butyrivibrio sp. WCE2006]
MDEKMRIIGRQMGIRMGILMSFFMAIIGPLSAGHLTIPGFISGFIISSIISIIIGLIIPVGKVTGAVCKKLKLERGKLLTRIVESLISDIIYTPVMTLAMVAFAYNMAMRQSGGMAQNSFLPMFLHSCIICFVVAFFLILIFQPLFMKMLMKKNGLE